MNQKTPQLENGYTRVANELLEALARQKLSGQEWQIVLALLRKLYGFGKKEDRISLGQICLLTGLHKVRISENISALVQRGIVTRKRNSRNVLLGINKDYSIWQQLRKTVTIAGKLRENVTAVTRNRNSQLRENVTPTTKETLTKETSSKERRPREKMMDFIKSVQTKDETFNKIVNYIQEQKRIPAESAAAALEDFVDYWTESNHTGTKQRWQLEKVFDVRRRIGTWFKRATEMRYGSRQTPPRGIKI